MASYPYFTDSNIQTREITMSLEVLSDKFSAVALPLLVLVLCVFTGLSCAVNEAVARVVAMKHISLWSDEYSFLFILIRQREHPAVATKPTRDVDPKLF